MVGIYKITNKLNGKSYIGQSIHCGERFEQHCHGKKQFIDETIQLEGKENFTFELLEECKKDQLNEKEDYYIKKYNTMFPNGYNKRWNMPQNQNIEEDYKLEPNLSEQKLKKLFKENVGLLELFQFLQSLYNTFEPEKRLFTKRMLVKELKYKDESKSYIRITILLCLLEVYELIKFKHFTTKEGYLIHHLDDIYQLDCSKIFE